ncbi:ABC transporter substrate-binding protein [Paenibacillus sp. N4]|uniref:ABC transporter substrate-binding protein n=1 Tax=Paenibacillus vietnamensis TaxID=2590547 RepID=UPI001CD13C52|nr:ABC transporter substrate-binding protein [Paenibacillus vietnamensis]MCA0757294.1 ABC transporter substrate-binding protein [Paenibacillus vietnamensis]
MARLKFLGSGLLVLALSLALVGCNGNDNGADKQGSVSGNSGGEVSGKLEPITISAFIKSANQQPTADNRIYKKIKDELGVTLKMEFLVGDLQQKLGVMIAGGDYPDIITGDTKLVGAKAVIPLEDLIEQHAPNLKKHYEKSWNRMKDSSDGHIYWLPNTGVFTGEVTATTHSGPAFWIQKEVLKEAGYPKLKTLDDYLKLIRDYAVKHPEIDGQPTIPFTTFASESKMFPLVNAPEHLAGYPNDGNVIVDNGVATVFSDKEISKRYYKELNTLYNEGLLDKEAFVQNYDQYLAKLSSGRVLGMFDQQWNFSKATEALVAQNKGNRTYVGIPLVYDSNIKDYYRDRSVANLNNGFGITKDAKDPVRIIKFLDTLITEDWQKLLNWGEKDIDYKVDENGLFYRTQEQREQQADPTWKLANKAEAFLAQAPKWEGTYSDGNASSPGGQPGEFYEVLKPWDKEVLDAYGYKSWTEFFSPAPENPVYYPAWQISLLDGSPAAIANKQMNDASLKFLPKVIMSKQDQFESTWNEYVNAFKKINVKAYEDRINEQIQWRIENWTNK